MSTETVHPETDRFVASINPAFVKQIFDVTQRGRKSNVHHYRKLDDLA
nr:hypothetical protein [Hyphomonas beringensis]